MVGIGYNPGRVKFVAFYNSMPFLINYLNLEAAYTLDLPRNQLDQARIHILFTRPKITIQRFPKLVAAMNPTSHGRLSGAITAATPPEPVLRYLNTALKFALNRPAISLENPIIPNIWVNKLPRGEKAASVQQHISSRQRRNSPGRIN